jgi:hypothetical protein
MGWINDGFSTTMYFSNAPSGVTLYFEEIDVTPPGVDMGGPNDTTTMRNSTWRTRQPKKLKTLTPMTATCKYDPRIYSQILDMIGVITDVVVTFPDGETEQFKGWIDKFIPNALVEGEMGTAVVTVEPSNQSAAGVEVAPVYQDN